MSFNSKDVISDMHTSMAAIALFNSSCQALIETSINPVESNWYNALSFELGEIEKLIISWRQGGYLYFYNSNLQNIIDCGQAFNDKKSEIDIQYEALAKDLSDSKRQVLDQVLNSLLPPITTIVNAITGYEVALKSYEQQVQNILDKMNDTITAIQKQESELQEDIEIINVKISNMQQQIQTDLEAIAKAKAARKRGITETVFGVILAPFTFGVSTILAGIGVATIVEAEDKISDMRNHISSFQQDISADTQKLGQDKQEITVLNGLLLSANIMIGNINFIERSMDTLKVSWGTLQGELQGAAQKVLDAKSVQDVIVSQTWFDAACDEWIIILDTANALLDTGQAPISTQKVQIG